MKFLQLGLGERFEYEGVVYTKSSPMLASRDGDGSSRSIARSADVRPLGRDVVQAPTKSGDALKRFHAEVRDLIGALPLTDEAARNAVLQQLDRLYQELSDGV